MFRAAVADLKPDRTSSTIIAPTCRRPTSGSLSRACALAVAGLAALTVPIAAQTTPPKEEIELDIPAQPLGTAISRYGNATGRDVLYDANLASGRLSSEVRGAFAPDEALKKLLVGTGLKAELVTGKTFALLPVPASPQTRQTSSPEHLHYYGLIQAGITDALCEALGVAADRSGRPAYLPRKGCVGGLGAFHALQLAIRGASGVQGRHV